MLRGLSRLFAVVWWALLACLSAVAAPLTQHKADEIAGKVTRFINGTREAKLAIGLSLAICIDGDLVLAQAFGDAAPGVAATPETLYPVGSLTKQFTAAAILAEIEHGATVRRSAKPLTLDMEIRDVLPGVDHWSKDPDHPVTVRRLLNMNSNLPNFTRRPPSGTDPWGTIPAEELMERLKAVEQSGWPDTFEYSNTNYFLLSEILEALDATATDHGSRETVRQLFFGKAGLIATGFTSDKTPPPGQLARPNYVRKPVFHLGDWLKGSGDMVSSVLDLTRWNSALMDGRILSAASRSLMFAEGARIGPTDWYGMGWFIAREPERDLYYHSGTVPGFTGFNAIAMPHKGPSWVSVTLLMNAENVSEIDELARELLDIALLD